MESILNVVRVPTIRFHAAAGHGFWQFWATRLGAVANDGRFRTALMVAILLGVAFLVLKLLARAVVIQG